MNLADLHGGDRVTDQLAAKDEEIARLREECTYARLQRISARTECTEAEAERDRARDTAAALATKVRDLADWHETKAEKAERFTVLTDVAEMRKAAQVHREAAARLRAALSGTTGEATR